jgi:hypothetical protein
VIIEDRNGKVEDTSANQDGADEVRFNEGNNSYFLAWPGGAKPHKLSITDVGDGGKVGSDQGVAMGLPDNPSSRLRDGPFGRRGPGL